jgi:hypothetical protein
VRDARVASGCFVCANPSFSTASPAFRYSVESDESGFAIPVA